MSNCCEFIDTFCTTSGIAVICRLVLVNGVLKKTYYKVSDGTIYTGNDVILNSNCN